MLYLNESILLTLGRLKRRGKPEEICCACAQVGSSPTGQPAAAPTALELQALEKLRESLSAGAGKPLRTFASVRDVYMETAEGSCASHPAGAIL